jgi:hypothetical protein
MTSVLVLSEPLNSLFVTAAFAGCTVVTGFISVSCMSSIFKESWLIARYLVRDTIGTAIYFGTYETVKQILSNGRGNGPAEPAAVALAGATCGIVSWTLVCHTSSTAVLWSSTNIVLDLPNRCCQDSVPEATIGNRSRTSITPEHQVLPTWLIQR